MLWRGFSFLGNQLLCHGEQASQERHRWVRRSPLMPPALPGHLNSYPTPPQLPCLLACIHPFAVIECTLLITSLFVLPSSLFHVGEANIPQPCLNRMWEKKPRARKMEQTPTRTRLLIIVLCTVFGVLKSHCLNQEPGQNRNARGTSKRVINKIPDQDETEFKTWQW